MTQTAESSRRRTYNNFLEVLVVDGPASRAHIARATGLSKPTISDAAEHLLNAGIIVHLGQHVSPQGRRPMQIYDFNAEYGHVVGVSVERGHVAVRALSFAGELVGQDRRDTEADDDVPAALSRART